jgi:prolyl-tRNA synthetase
VSLPPDPIPLPGEDCTLLATPGQRSIEALCRAHGFDATQTVKVLLMLARFADGGSRPVLVSLRGDQQLNEVKLANALTLLCPGAGALLELAPITPDQLAAESIDPLPFGFLGPQLEDGVLGGALSWSRSFLRLGDPTACDLDRFVCGANRIDHHLVGARWGEITPAPERVDLRSAQPGDRCLHDPSMQLEAARGIEVGHIFQLGRKYSEALGARFTNEAGVEEALWMGCYGIGVSRLAQAAVEQHHDADGILWPLPIAPYEVIVVIANGEDPTQVALAERLYDQLAGAAIEVLLDDRDERAGVKFKDADLIGIPWRVVVGRGAARGMVELVRRADGTRSERTVEDALASLVAVIPTERLVHQNR